MRVCMRVYMHSGPVWMKCPGLICPSRALPISLLHACACQAFLYAFKYISTVCSKPKLC